MMSNLSIALSLTFWSFFFVVIVVSFDLSNHTVSLSFLCFQYFFFAFDFFNKMRGTRVVSVGLFFLFCSLEGENGEILLNSLLSLGRLYRNMKFRNRRVKIERKLMNKDVIKLIISSYQICSYTCLLF